MKCPNCSAQQPDDSKECAGCGVIFAKLQANPRESRSSGVSAPGPIASPMSEGYSFRFGAVIKGLAVGVIAGLIESAVVGGYFASQQPVADLQNAEKLKATLMASSNYLMADLAGSMLCVMIGGYIAAGAAGHSGVKHAFAVGALYTCILAVMVVASPGPPFWYNAAVLCLTIPCAVVGGMFN